VTRARDFVDTDVGRIVIVTRRPRTGRETRAFGGAALFRGKRVLDIGTGNGRLAFEIAPFARSVLGIDPSEGAIALARDTAARRHVRNATFQVGDAQTLRGIRGPFDVTLFSWSL
jgi:ubiquinone/menaquinone biosynthesis C-methylase UbiE